MKIYIENPIVSKGLKEFLEDFFTAAGGFGKKTFLDKEFTNLQYKIGRRSLDDLLIICNTYFENIKDVDILKALSSINGFFYLNYCDTPNKPVIKKAIDRDSFQNLVDSYSESYGLEKNFYYWKQYDENFGNSQYSVEKIIKLLKDI